MPNIGLNTGLKALLSASYGLNTVGHNVANASTPGYSRQRVDLTSTSPIFLGRSLIGTGVMVDSVRRSADELLARRILAQVSVSGRLESRAAGLSELESYLNEPSSGLGGLLDAFFAKVSDLAAKPEDKVERAGLAAAAGDLAGSFNQIAGQLGKLRAGFEKDIEAKVSEVNLLARDIAVLNDEIGKTEADGTSANDLRDKRDLAIKDLARIVDLDALEDSNGVVRVLVAGSLLVDSSEAHELSVEAKNDGSLTFRIDGVSGKVGVKGGVLGGLSDLHQNSVPTVGADLDRIARNLILEANRVHSVGIPASGPFESLVGSNPIQDLDQDGKRTDELLSNAGLPFDVASGELYVNVSDQTTGELTKHKIAIDATHTTTGDLVAALNALPHLGASIDALGRLRIDAESGYGFDFSPRLDATPDTAGTLGGAQASLGSSAAGPFALADGDTLDLTVNGGAGPTAVSIAFQTSDFADIGAATASEVAAAINADAGAQAAGLTAVEIGGRLFVQSAISGTASSITVDGGSSLAAFGWGALVGSTTTGQAAGVAVAASGSYSGQENSELVFVPNMDGAIGTTPGLAIEVRSATGALLATLPVGAGYVPGTPLAIGDGVSLSFGVGQVSASDNDAFALDLVADSDSSDVLVALGLNSFFTGSGAADIGVRADLADDPDLIAGSLSGAQGDGSGLLALLDVQELEMAGLEGGTLSEAYGDAVGTLGFEVSSNGAGLEANEALLASLELRHESIAGVNVDEELLNMMQLEQTYGAAVQYISVLNGLHQDILNLI